MSIGFTPLLFYSYRISDSVEAYFIEIRRADLVRTASIIGNRVMRENYLFDEALLPRFRVSMYERSLDEGARILVLDNRGIVITDSSSSAEGDIFPIPEVIEALQGTPMVRVQADGETAITAVPISDQYANVVGIVLLVSSVQDVNELRGIIQDQTTLLNYIIVGVAILLAFFASSIILGPLKNLLRVVARMSEGYLDQRVEVIGKDEFSQLCKAFNEMSDKLEQVEKNREEFVSNVSHELKTPLSSIKVLSESILFQENVPAETYREFLHDINSETDRMDQIVNDLLTLVRLDQTVMGMNITVIDLNKLVVDIVRRLKPLADKKNINLTKEGFENISIKADEMKLALALSNLVENAIKYTEEGSVKVILDTDHQHAFIKVVDTGIGMAESEQNKIFTRFYRVDKTRDRGTGGTGLGLSITHTTILLHGGSIRVSSKEGEGSTFIVRLPFK